MVPSAITPDTESKLSDLSEELDLLPQFQQMLNEERDVLPQYQAPSPSASENLIDLRDKGAQMDQQQWHLLRTLPEALVTTQELQEGPGASPKWVHNSQRAPAVEESEDIPSLNPPPSPAMAAAICLMVEDPYFDAPMSSPSSEEAPMDSTKHDKQWTVSPIFSTPSLCLNDQILELNSPASGKWSYLKSTDSRVVEFNFVDICVNWCVGL